MVLKLYGSPFSALSKLVAAILYEKEVSFEYIHIDLMKGETKSAAHLVRNPWGTVPVIDDDGFILYESRAIVRYIVDKYSAKGPQLIPSNVQKRALLEQAIFTEAFNYDRYANAILVEAVYKKFRGEEPDPVKVKEMTETFASKLDVYEGILSKQKYIAGDELTIADFYHLPIGTSLIDLAGINVVQDRPNVAKWFNEISSRPSWQRAQTAFDQAST